MFQSCWMIYMHAYDLKYLVFKQKGNDMEYIYATARIYTFFRQ